MRPGLVAAAAVLALAACADPSAEGACVLPCTSRYVLTGKAD